MLRPIRIQNKLLQPKCKACKQAEKIQQLVSCHYTHSPGHQLTWFPTWHRPHQLGHHTDPGNQSICHVHKPTSRSHWIRHSPLLGWLHLVSTRCWVVALHRGSPRLKCGAPSPVIMNTSISSIMTKMYCIYMYMYNLHISAEMLPLCPSLSWPWLHFPLIHKPDSPPFVHGHRQSSFADSALVPLW